MACTHEALASYTRDPGAYGPTNTATVQRNFEQRLRGVLSRINARIREAVDERDLFGLREEALADDVPGGVFDFPTSQQKVRGLMAWLRQQLDENLLEVVGPDRNQFIRAAYAAGIREAYQDLSELDVAFDRPDMDDLLSRPIHRTALQTLYTRVYENLQSVRDDVAQEVRDELVSGLRAGENPRDIARSLTGRVDSIGKNRATMIARSEVMNAWSESYLNRNEEIADDTGTNIGVTHSEWMDSNDARVCAFCRALDGTVFTINEMRNRTVEIAGQVFRLRPPAHPGGRCALKTVVGFDPSDLAPFNERVPTESDLA